MQIESYYFTLHQQKINLQQIIIPEATANSPTLVFLHDALGCIAAWKNFPKLLCQKLNCNGILYDRIGHGNSSPSTTKRKINYLETEAVKVVPIILQELKIENPILVGCSDGASIALIFAAHFREVSAVISIAGHAYVEEITLAGIEESKTYLQQKSIFEKLEKLHGAKTQQLIDDWAETWLSPKFRNWNINSILKNIQCPTLVLQGELDNYATPEHCKSIVTNIGKNAKGVMIKDAGHFPHLEKTELVIALIQDFLEKFN